LVVLRQRDGLYCNREGGDVMRVFYFILAFFAVLIESDRVDQFVCWVIDALALTTFCIFLAFFGTIAIGLIFN